MFGFLTDPSLTSLLMVALLPMLIGATATTNGETIETVPILKGVKRIDLPKNIFSRIKLRVTSNNKSNEKVTFSDLGRLRLVREQHDVQKPSWGFTTWNRLKQIVNEFFEWSPTISATDGDTSTLETYLTNRIPGLLEDNAFHVPQHDETTIVADFDSTPGASSGGLNGLANGGQLEVIGYTNPDLAEQAMLTWDYLNPAYSGGVNEQEVEGLTGDNVALIFIHDPDDVVDGISLTRHMPGGIGSEKVWDGQSKSRVQGWYADQRPSFGSSSLTGIIVAASAHPTQLRNEGVTLELSTSGGSQNIQVMYARVTDPVPSASEAQRNQRRRQIARA